MLLTEVLIVAAIAISPALPLIGMMAYTFIAYK